MSTKTKSPAASKLVANKVISIRAAKSASGVPMHAATIRALVASALVSGGQGPNRLVEDVRYKASTTKNGEIRLSITDGRHRVAALAFIVEHDDDKEPLLAENVAEMSIKVFKAHAAVFTEAGVETSVMSDVAAEILKRGKTGGLDGLRHVVRRHPSASARAAAVVEYSTGNARIAGMTVAELAGLCDVSKRSLETARATHNLWQQLCEEYDGEEDIKSIWPDVLAGQLALNKALKRLKGVEGVEIVPPKPRPTNAKVKDAHAKRAMAAALVIQELVVSWDRDPTTVTAERAGQLYEQASSALAAFASQVAEVEASRDDDSEE